MDIEKLKAILVTHAPPPQDWFYPKMDMDEPPLIFFEGASRSTELNATNESRQANAEWWTKYAKEKQIQWPIAWANEIIKAIIDVVYVDKE